MDRKRKRQIMQASDVVPDACIFLSDTVILPETVILHGHNDFANGEGEMKRHYQPTEDQTPLESGAAQSDFAGRRTCGVAGSATSDAGVPQAAPVVTLAAPAGGAWWEEDEPETRTGGVCLLIA